MIEIQTEGQVQGGTDRKHENDININYARKESFLPVFKD